MKKVLSSSYPIAKVVIYLLISSCAVEGYILLFENILLLSELLLISANCLRLGRRGKSHLIKNCTCCFVIVLYLKPVSFLRWILVKDLL